MIEVLFVEFQDSLNLDVGVDIDLPLVSERDFNIRDETDSDSHCPLRHNLAQLSCLLIRLQVVRRGSDHGWERSLELNNFVFEDSVANLVTCDFSELIDSCDVLLLDVKLDFNVASISRKRPQLRTTHNLKSIAHVGCNQELLRIDLKQREDLKSEHLGNDRHFNFIQVLLPRLAILTLQLEVVMLQ